MNACREDLLLDYLDGALEGAAQQCAEQHLQVCERCRKKLEAFRATLHLVGQVRRAPLSPLRARSLPHQVRQTLRARKRIRRTLFTGLAAACCLALVLVRPPAGQEGESEAAAPVAASVPAPEQDGAWVHYLDAYLLDTASTEELFREMQEVEVQDLVALVEDLP